MTRAMLLAAPMSGSGKTSICRGLAAAFALGRAEAKLQVRTFKMGPDYLDPLHLSAAVNSPCHNLDPWMMGKAACRKLFTRSCLLDSPRPDLALVEGAMGLYDGGDPASNAGSSADLAKTLDIPVVLVVDIARQGRSVAALVKGFVEFDPELRLAGLILNRAGSESHANLVRTALASMLPRIAIFGCLPAQEYLALPSRHLGLQPPKMDVGPDTTTLALADWVSAHLNLKALLAALPTLHFKDFPEEIPSPPLSLPSSTDLNATSSRHFPSESRGERVHEEDVELSPRPTSAVVDDELHPPKPRIAVSRDAAFYFLYADNLERLRAAGAELVFFSPLADAALPEGCAGLYLCGGYPELHGRELSANKGMLESIRSFIRAEGPVFAECGGYMYLMAELMDAAGAAWPLLGHFPWSCRMENKRRGLGYRAARTLVPSCLGPVGTLLRGHVFHYSTAAEPGDLDLTPNGNMPEEPRRPQRLFNAENAAGITQPPFGVSLGSVAASYLHVHFASNPDLAQNFVAACAAFGVKHEFI